MGPPGIALTFAEISKPSMGKRRGRRCVDMAPPDPVFPVDSASLGSADQVSSRFREVRFLSQKQGLTAV